MNDFPRIIYKRHTFLSSLAMGLSAIIIAFIVSCTVVIVYGMNFAGEKSEEIVALVEKAVSGLPELQESLPPALADMLNDHRQPDYAAQLDITAKTTLLPNDQGTVKTTVEIVNNGKEVVSLLSMRVVVMTSQGDIFTESNEWGATPIAADHDWRGPLMPGSRRYFVASHRRLPVFSTDELKTEVEITDIRIWNSEKGSTWFEGRKSSEAKPPDSNAAAPAENP
ncbi:MAG: hypothetical protein JXA81_06550 [Sedimentisphaerales bacterium]|nr:hypothetical protein [Sedimentisphaerales bacterium]